MPDPKPRRTWRQRLRFRLSVRALMVLVLVLGGWLGWVVHRARVQREVVATIVRAGGRVWYDDVWYDEVEVIVDATDGTVLGPKRKSWPPPWLVDSLGIDYFFSVVQVGFNKPGADEVASCVARLPRVDTLYFGNSDLSDSGLARFRGLDLRELLLRGTKVTDAGVRHLRGLTNLKDLDLSSTSVGDAAMAQVANLSKLERLVLERHERHRSRRGIDRQAPGPQSLGPVCEDPRWATRGAALLASKAGLEDIELHDTRE